MCHIMGYVWERWKFLALLRKNCQNKTFLFQLETNLARDLQTYPKSMIWIQNLILRYVSWFCFDINILGLKNVFFLVLSPRSSRSFSPLVSSVRGSLCYDALSQKTVLRFSLSPHHHQCNTGQCMHRLHASHCMHARISRNNKKSSNYHMTERTHIPWTILLAKISCLSIPCKTWISNV